VLELVSTLRSEHDDAVDVRLSAMTAAAIVHIEARRHGALAPHDTHAAFAAVGRSATVGRATAQRWRDDAWQAVGEGLLAPADAQALNDQLEPRGAA
jgi:hypothetical protein